MNLTNISIIVLTMWWEAHRHLLSYNKDEDLDNNLDERVLNRVDDKYNTNNCRYTYSIERILPIIDHTNE